MGFHKESFNGEEACAFLSEENVVLFHVCLCPIVGQFPSGLLFLGWQFPDMKSHLVFCGVYNKMLP